MALDILGKLRGTPAYVGYMLVIVALHYKWQDLLLLSHITTHAVNEFLSDVFARWGLPEELLIDNA